MRGAVPAAQSGIHHGDPSLPGEPEGWQRIHSAVVNSVNPGPGMSFTLSPRAGTVGTDDQGQTQNFHSNACQMKHSLARVLEGAPAPPGQCPNP